MPSFVCCFGHPSPWWRMTSTSCLFWHGRRRDTGFSMICIPLVTFQGKAGHWETFQLETWLVRWLLLPFTHWNASLRYPWKIPEQNSHVLVCHSPLLDHQTRELRPSQWIEWSLERLTSHLMRSNSYCSPPQSQKHTVRRQKWSHMLEEMMEPERPLVWSCPFIDLNGNILYWEARNVSLVHFKFAADLQEKKPTHATNQEAEGEALVDLQHTDCTVMLNTRWSCGIFRILCKQLWWWLSELLQIAWPAVDSGSICHRPNAHVKVNGLVVPCVMQMSFQVLELRKNHILPKLIDLLRDRRDHFVFSQWEVTIVKMIKNARRSHEPQAFHNMDSIDQAIACHRLSFVTWHASFVWLNVEAII